MATMHGLMDFYVGDTIMIDVTINDSEGNLLDLTNADVEWLLNGTHGEHVETLSIRNSVTIGDITIGDPLQGKISITVPSSRTGNYQVGYHHDQLRVWLTDPGFEKVLATELVGTIKMRKPLVGHVVTLSAGNFATSPPNLL
jgi:hypothetical protein